MDFERAHQAFIEHHTARRSGERKGRLLRGHNYAEKLLLQNVWWPLFGNFDDLHPEYEAMTGTASRNFWISRSFRSSAGSAWSATVFKVM